MKATRDAVFEAANTLSDAGQMPSGAAIRRIIGGGSFSTIQTYLLEWRGSQNSPSQRGPSTPLPQLLADALQRMGQDLWQRASAIAQGQLAGERAAMMEAIELHDASRQEAAAMADQLSAELERAQGEHENATRREARLQKELIDTQRELAVAHARLSELQGQAEHLRHAEVAAVERAAALGGRLEVLEAQNVALLARVAPSVGRQGASSPDAARPPGQ